MGVQTLVNGIMRPWLRLTRIFIIRGRLIKVPPGEGGGCAWLVIARDLPQLSA
jgi:hypothetical protein